MNPVTHFDGRQNPEDFLRSATQLIKDADVVILITGKLGPDDNLALDQRMTCPDGYDQNKLFGTVLDHAREKINTLPVN